LELLAWATHRIATTERYTAADDEEIRAVMTAAAWHSSVN
jgi:hypothetical protein